MPKGPASGRQQEIGPSAHGSTASKPAEGLSKARILVVDDYPFVREALAYLLNRQSDLTFCGEADSVAAATPAAVAKANPDVLLLDLQLGDGDGFRVIQALRPQFPRLAILILSQWGDAAYAEKALRAGARGYIVKQEAADEILTAIRTVLRGGIYVSRELAGRLLQKLVSSPEFFAAGSSSNDSTVREIK